MKTIKVKTRNNFKKLHISKKVHVSSTQWTAFRSIQFLRTNAKLCLYKKKLPVAIPAESLSPTPLPANSSTGLTHKCLKPVDISNHEWVSWPWARLTLSTAQVRGWQAAAQRARNPRAEMGVLQCYCQPLHLMKWVKQGWTVHRLQQLLKSPTGKIQKNLFWARKQPQ